MGTGFTGLGKGAVGFGTCTTRLGTGIGIAVTGFAVTGLAVVGFAVTGLLDAGCDVSVESP